MDRLSKASKSAIFGASRAEGSASGGGSGSGKASLAYREPRPTFLQRLKSARVHHRPQANRKHRSSARPLNKPAQAVTTSRKEPALKSLSLGGAYPAWVGLSPTRKHREGSFQSHAHFNFVTGSAQNSARKLAAPGLCKAPSPVGRLVENHFVEHVDLETVSPRTSKHTKASDIEDSWKGKEKAFNGEQESDRQASEPKQASRFNDQESSDEGDGTDGWGLENSDEDSCSSISENDDFIEADATLVELADHMTIAYEEPRKSISKSFQCVTEQITRTFAESGKLSVRTSSIISHATTNCETMQAEKVSAVTELLSTFAALQDDITGLTTKFADLRRADKNMKHEFLHSMTTLKAEHDHELKDLKQEHAALLKASESAINEAKSDKTERREMQKKLAVFLTS